MNPQERWLMKHFLKLEVRDFPGGAVVKTSPLSAETGFDPWSGN